MVGRTREPGGPPATWTVDVGALVSMVDNAGSGSGVYRDLDAAARAVLERDDSAPLLRLAAQSIHTDDSARWRSTPPGCTSRSPATTTRRPSAGRPKGAVATLRMSWNDKGRHPLARVTGRAGGDRLAATLPAPYAPGRQWRGSQSSSSAFHVRGPTVFPVAGLRPWACWNSLMALTVLGPYSPVSLN